MPQDNRTIVVPFSQMPTADKARAGDILLLSDVPGAQATCMPLPEQALAQLADPAAKAVLDAALLGRKNYWRWDEPRQSLPVTAANVSGPPRKHLIVQYDGAADSDVGMPLFNILNLDPANVNPDLGNVTPGVRSPRTITNFTGVPNMNRVVRFGAATTSALFAIIFGGYNAAHLLPSATPIGLATELPDNTFPVQGVNLKGLIIGSGYGELAAGADISQGSLVFWDDANKKWDLTLPPKGDKAASFAGVLLAAPSEQAAPSVTDRPFLCLLSPLF